MSKTTYGGTSWTSQWGVKNTDKDRLQFNKTADKAEDPQSTTENGTRTALKKKPAIKKLDLSKLNEKPPKPTFVEKTNDENNKIISNFKIAGG